MTADGPWEGQARQWRDPAQIVAQWEHAGVDNASLRHRTRGAFWEVLEGSGATLLVSREYEHFLMALGIRAGRPHVSFLPLPHPSGIAVDDRRNRVFVASTRNPNQVHELAAIQSTVERLDLPAGPDADAARPLMPVRSWTYPGSLYMHDLAFVGDALHANAAGRNTVIRLDERGGWKEAWWPHAIEREGVPETRLNYLQLNSIAAGPTLARSFFSASSERIGRRRPGHLDFPVDGRGVVFSGRTREPVVRGLTRPHSARLRNERLWVLNSGYGELVRVDEGRAEALCRLEGWTRGLWFGRDVAFVGTSRVIPRFRRYAPGLDLDRSRCAIHAIDLQTGRSMGSVEWPEGNQIFAVEGVPRELTLGLPFLQHPRRTKAALFYTFSTEPTTTREGSGT